MGTKIVGTIVGLIYLLKATLLNSGYLKPKDYGPDDFKLELLYRINLLDYIKRYKSQRGQNSIRPWGYRIYLSYGNGYSEFDGVYKDGEYNFILARPNILRLDQAIACIGFDVSEDHIVIKQIQGVSRQGWELSYIRWERMLLKIVLDWAVAHGYKEVRVIHYKDNKWACSCSNKECRRCKSMLMHYDVTAKRMGFKFNESLKQYIMPIGTT